MSAGLQRRWQSHPLLLLPTSPYSKIRQPSCWEDRLRRDLWHAKGVRRHGSLEGGSSSASGIRQWPEALVTHRPRADGTALLGRPRRLRRCDMKRARLTARCAGFVCLRRRPWGASLEGHRPSADAASNSVDSGFGPWWQRQHRATVQALPAGVTVIWYACICHYCRVRLDWACEAESSTLGLGQASPASLSATTRTRWRRRSRRQK